MPLYAGVASDRPKLEGDRILEGVSVRRGAACRRVDEGRDALAVRHKGTIG